MKIRMKTPLLVIGKPTQQGKKDATVTYYYATVSQGEEDAGKIRVADVNVYNRIEKYKTQLFTCEYNEQYNSFSIVDVEPLNDKQDTGVAPNVESAVASALSTGTDTGKAPDAPVPDTGKAPDAPTPDTGKADKKH